MVVVRHSRYFSLLLFSILISLPSILKSQASVQITGENVSGEPGDIVCLNYVVSNFEGILGFEFSINFDANLLDFEIVNTPGNLDGYNGGVTANTDCLMTGAWAPPHCNSLGRVSFINSLWTGSDFTSGHSLADGSQLFEICFRIKDDAVPGRCASINLNAHGVASNDETIEIFDFNLQQLGADITNSEICVDAPESAILSAEILTSCSSSMSGTPPYRVDNTTSGNTVNITDNGGIYTENGLAPGTYEIQVFDATNAQVPLTIEINDQNSLTLNTTITEPTCADAENGSIEVNVLGGSPLENGNYQFEWSNTLIDLTDNAMVDGLSNGTYNVTVTDATNCSVVETFVLNQEPLNFTYRIDNNFCEGNSPVVTIFPTGGSGFFSASLFQVPFRSNFNFRDSVSFNMANNAGEFTPGIYTIGIEDNATTNCEFSLEFDVQFESVLTADVVVTNIDCVTGENSYEVELSNDNGQPITEYSYQVTELSSPAVVIPPTVGSGSVITLPNLPFSMDGYQIEILTNDGCSTTEMLPSSAGSGTLTLLDSIVNQSCTDIANGSITIDIDSDSDVTYEWSTGDIETTPAASPGFSYMDLDTGTYSVTITNTSGCQISTSFFIPPVELMISSAPNNMITCNDATGDITAIVTGGVQDYMYAWDHPNNDGTEVLTGVNAGESISLTVTDFNGCTTETTLSLAAADAVSLDIITNNPPTCHNESNGTVIAQASGGPDGSGIYEYTWSNGLVDQVASSSINNQFSSGSHWVVATDFTCESDTIFFDVEMGIEYQVDLSATTINAPQCGQDDASIFIELIPDVPGIFTFDLPEQGRFDETSSFQDGLPAGDIPIVIRDVNGCESMDTITIQAIDEVIIEINPVASVFPNCADEEFATIVIDASGGIGSYTYAWTNSNSISETASGLSPGTYSVTVTDEDGCSAEINNIVVDIPEEIQAEVGTLFPLCENEMGGIFVENITGGSGMGYSFQVNTDPVVDAMDTASVFPNTYIVRVYDSEGCSAEFTDVTIASGNVITVELDPPSPNVILGNSVTITARTESSVLEPDYDWNITEGATFNPDMSEITFTPSSNITLQVIVTDEFGCSAFDEILVTVTEDISLWVPDIFRLGDGNMNNRMQVYAGQDITNIDQVQVFDRWGNIVFETSNNSPNILPTDNYWDGRISGTEANSGVYVYRIEFTKFSGESEVLVGDITLIR